MQETAKQTETQTDEGQVLLGEVSERLGPKLEEVQTQLSAVNERVKGFIREHPGATLLGVAGLGFVIGRLASRR